MEVAWVARWFDRGAHKGLYRLSLPLPPSHVHLPTLNTTPPSSPHPVPSSTRPTSRTPSCSAPSLLAPIWGAPTWRGRTLQTHCWTSCSSRWGLTEFDRAWPGLAVLDVPWPVAFCNLAPASSDMRPTHPTPSTLTRYSPPPPTPTPGALQVRRRRQPRDGQLDAQVPRLRQHAALQGGFKMCGACSAVLVSSSLRWHRPSSQLSSQPTNHPTVQPSIHPPPPRPPPPPTPRAPRCRMTRRTHSAPPCRSTGSSADGWTHMDGRMGGMVLAGSSAGCCCKFGSD